MQVLLPGRLEYIVNFVCFAMPLFDLGVYLLSIFKSAHTQSYDVFMQSKSPLDRNRAFM